MAIMDQAAQQKPQNISGDAGTQHKFTWTVPEDYNFAFDAVGRWAEEAEKLAMRWAGPDGDDERYTFAALDEQSSRVANALKKHGVTKGERVLLMLPRVPEWWETMLGLMKLGAVAIPCTTLLTPEDVRYRAEVAEAVTLVTDRAGAGQWARVCAECPSVRQVMVVGEPGDECPEQCIGYHPAIDVASPVWYNRVTRASDPCLICFTSGTVDFPRMMLRSRVGHSGGRVLVTERHWLALRPADLAPNLSEVGWVGLLDGWFDSLAPAPYHWCPLQTAAADTPASEGYYVLDHACRMVPVLGGTSAAGTAGSPTKPAPSPDQGQG